MSGIILDRAGAEVVDRTGQQVHDRFVVSTGALAAQSAFVAGVGTVGAAGVIGSGACVSQTASVAGTGVPLPSGIISVGRATSGELVVRYTSPEYYRLQRQGYQVTRFVSPTAVHMQRMP